MSEHKATIRWTRKTPDFLNGKYSREHAWTFDGGVIVAASPSPLVVPAPYSNAANIDPEEAFVAAVSSCHMLTYLYLASRQGFQIDSYHDEAVGVMTKNEKGIPLGEPGDAPPENRLQRREIAHTCGRTATSPQRSRTVLHCQFHQDRSSS